jgi:arabinofuranosyltransferase
MVTAPALRHDDPSKTRVAGSRSGRVVRNLLTALPAVVILIGGWLHRWTNEDAFINFRIVDQILAGHGPVFNTGERVEAFTSPLWLGVLVIIRVTLGAVLSFQWATLVVTLALATAGFAIAALTTRRVHPAGESVVPIGLLTMAAVPVVWDFATSGLEIGLVWFWIACCWSVLVRAGQGAAWTRRRSIGALLVLGLGPVVRPDLGLMSVCFVAAWLFIMKPALPRMAVDVVVAFSIAIAYQVFRMGYYASLIPTTALAKDAGGGHLRQGIKYALDLSRPYALWIPLLLVVGLIARTLARSPKPLQVAIVAMTAAGVLHAAYMVVIGGDYIHGRLLLPALFAFVVPAAVGWPSGLVVARRPVIAGAVVAIASIWAVTCAGWLRYHNQRTLMLAPITNWRDLSPRPLVEPRENRTAFWSGAQIAKAYERGERGTIPLLGNRVIRTGDPTKLVVILGSIGLAGFNAGIHVRVVDLGGLAEPLAARTNPVPGRPAGHRKQIDGAWHTARFGVPDLAPDPRKVVAARAALRCAPLSSLLAAIDKPLTPGRFVGNMVHSFQFTQMRIPQNPIEAERKFCRH